jgi:hypothetical protein
VSAVATPTPADPASEAETRADGAASTPTFAVITPAPRLAGYLAAAICVTVVAALVALARALDGGDEPSRQAPPAASAFGSAPEAEIDVGELEPPSPPAPGR